MNYRWMILVFATALALACTSCSDVVEIPGPQGEQGVAGTSGNDGVNGTDGEKGEKGEQGLPGNTGQNGADGQSCKASCSKEGTTWYLVMTCGTDTVKAKVSSCLVIVPIEE